MNFSLSQRISFRLSGKSWRRAGFGGRGLAQYDQSHTRWAFLCAAAPLSPCLIDVCCPPIRRRSAVSWTEQLLRAAGDDLSEVTSHMCSMDHRLSRQREQYRKLN